MKYVLAAVILYALFFLLCCLNTGTDRKNIRNFWSYPESVRSRIRMDTELSSFIPDKKPVWETLLANYLVFIIVFIVIGILLQIHDFRHAFWYFLTAGEGLNLFDLLCIDKLWWTRTDRIRFTSVNDPSQYSNMHVHVQSFLRGIPVMFAAALTASCILMRI